MKIVGTHYDPEAQRVVLILKDGSIQYRGLTGGGWTTLPGPDPIPDEIGPDGTAYFRTPRLRVGPTVPAFQRGPVPALDPHAPGVRAESRLATEALPGPEGGQWVGCTHCEDLTLTFPEGDWRRVTSCLSCETRLPMEIVRWTE